MPSKYASGKKAIASCDRCGFRYKLKQLKNLVIKAKNVNILVCPDCWEPDQPQLLLGMYPVNDPQAIRDPRPELGYYVSGPGGDGGSLGSSGGQGWSGNYAGGPGGAAGAAVVGSSYINWSNQGTIYGSLS